MSAHLTRLRAVLQQALLTLRSSGDRVGRLSLNTLVGLLLSHACYEVLKYLYRRLRSIAPAVTVTNYEEVTGAPKLVTSEEGVYVMLGQHMEKLTKMEFSGPVDNLTVHAMVQLRYHTFASGEAVLTTMNNTEAGTHTKGVLRVGYSYDGTKITDVGFGLLLKSGKDVFLAVNQHVMQAVPTDNVQYYLGYIRNGNTDWVPNSTARAVKIDFSTRDHDKELIAPCSNRDITFFKAGKGAAQLPAAYENPTTARWNELFHDDPPAYALYRNDDGTLAHGHGFAITRTFGERHGVFAHTINTSNGSSGSFIMSNGNLIGMHLGVVFTSDGHLPVNVGLELPYIFQLLKRTRYNKIWSWGESGSTESPPYSESAGGISEQELDDIYQYMQDNEHHFRMTLEDELSAIDVSGFRDHTPRGRRSRRGQDDGHGESAPSPSSTQPPVQTFVPSVDPPDDILDAMAAKLDQDRTGVRRLLHLMREAQVTAAPAQGESQASVIPHETSLADTLINHRSAINRKLDKALANPSMRSRRSNRMARGTGHSASNISTADTWSPDVVQRVTTLLRDELDRTVRQFSVTDLNDFSVGSIEDVLGVSVSHGPRGNYSVLSANPKSVIRAAETTGYGDDHPVNASRITEYLRSVTESPDPLEALTNPHRPQLTVRRLGQIPPHCFKALSMFDVDLTEDTTTVTVGPNNHLLMHNNRVPRNAPPGKQATPVADDQMKFLNTALQEQGLPPITTKMWHPDTTPDGMLASLKSQVCKAGEVLREPHRYGFDPAEWSKRFPSVNYEGLHDLRNAISEAIWACELQKAGGWSQIATGYNTKAELLENQPGHFGLAVLERLAVLMMCRDIGSASPAACARARLVNPRVLFTKNELHGDRKAAASRWRQIHNVSFLDEVVERLLCGPIAKALHKNYTTGRALQRNSLGNCVGLGHDDSSAALTCAYLTEMHRKAGRDHFMFSDIQGYDMSQGKGLFRASAASITHVAMDGFLADPFTRAGVGKMVFNHLMSQANQVFLVGRHLFSLALPGGMSTGRYLTGVLNGVHRELIFDCAVTDAGLDHLESLNQGDDQIAMSPPEPMEANVEKIMAAQAQYGFVVKPGSAACKNEQLDFTSHTYDVGLNKAVYNNLDKLFCTVAAARVASSDQIAGWRWAVRHCTYAERRVLETLISVKRIDETVSGDLGLGIC